VTSRATRRAPLGAIAYARSGDKGAHANVGVWVRHDDAYAFVRDTLTADIVADHFALADSRQVERYELANLRALNFVLCGVLGAGGGATSLRTDAQAKAYGQALLRVELSIPLTLLASATRPPFETRHP
jgi:hypothetical protein